MQGNDLNLMKNWKLYVTSSILWSQFHTFIPNVDGSIGTTCDANGMCSCKAGYFSNKCKNGKCK